MRIIYLTALLSWACGACTPGPDDQNDILRQALLRTMEDAEYWVKDHGNYWRNYTQYELENPSRKKFLPLLECLDSIEHTCARAEELLLGLSAKIVDAKQKSLTNQEWEVSQRQLDSLQQRLFFHYSNFLQTYHQQFGLTLEEVDAMKQSVHEKLVPLNAFQLWERIADFSEVEQKLAIRILRADWANAKTMLVNETSLSRFLGCGRIFYIDEVSIVPHQNKVRRGDVFQARIAFNSNDFKYEHSRKKLFVDGVELPIIARIYAEYVSAPMLEKEQSITITAQIQNALTGEFEEAFPPFEYIIRTD